MARSTKSDNASIPFQYFGKVCWSLRSVGLHCGWKVAKVRPHGWCWVLSDCRIVRTGCYVRWVANSNVYKNSWNYTYISAILLLPIIAFRIQLIFGFCFGLLCFLTCFDVTHFKLEQWIEASVTFFSISSYLFHSRDLNDSYSIDLWPRCFRTNALVESIDVFFFQKHFCNLFSVNMIIIKNTIALVDSNDFDKSMNLCKISLWFELKEIASTW